MKKILFVFVFFLASNVSADLYKWVDEKGVTHYSNTPRLKNTDKDVKTYKEVDASHKFSGFNARKKQESVSESFSELISAGIKENCMKEWGNNYRMVEYCVKRQSQAKSWLLSNSAAIPPEILRRCKSEWKTNYRMVKYCVENQSKSKRNLNIGTNSNQRSNGASGPENCQGCCSRRGGVVCRNGITMCADGTNLSPRCRTKGCDMCP